jgi:hypothetical protein
LIALAGLTALLATLGPAPVRGTGPRPVEGYFSLRPDPRLCPSPVCGGVFASLLNQAVTRCPTGDAAAACHASFVDWSRLGLDDDAQAELETAVLAGRGLVRGELVAGDPVEGFGTLGKLVVTEGWIAASARLPRGSFFRVAPNGIVCITTPCFSLRESLLNTPRRSNVSGLDLTPSGAPVATRDAAWQELSRGSVLAAGHNRVVRDPITGGRGVDLVATQFYLRVGRH